MTTTCSVRILSTKYDGSPHNDYMAELLDAGDPASGAPMRLLVPRGTLIRSYRGDYPSRVTFTALYWPGADCWWNVEHNHEAWRGRSGTAMLSYANISTPAEFDGETLRWVDLDLDVIVTDGSPQIVDEDEFVAHITRFAYPPDLVARATEAATTLLGLAARHAPPFDRETYLGR